MVVKDPMVLVINSRGFPGVLAKFLTWLIQSAPPLHCPAVKSFWKDVVHLVSLMLKVELSPCPLICLLGCRAAQLRPKRDRKIAGLGFFVAKRMILMNWKTHKTNCFLKETWLLEFFYLLGMERMADLLNDCTNNFDINWDQVLGTIAEFQI